MGCGLESSRHQAATKALTVRSRERFTKPVLPVALLGKDCSWRYRHREYTVDPGRPGAGSLTNIA
jgi:hypothetical protein